MSENKELMQEWDWEANIDLDPSKLTIGSSKKVWWKCPKCGYKWQAAVGDRGSGHGCPACAKIQRKKTFSKSILNKRGSLAEKVPELAKKWHSTKNGDLTPTDVTVGSKKRVWWKCPIGHEYEQAINVHSLHPNSCPVCSGHRLLQGINDLQSKYPEIAKEWHPTKNGNLKPSDVTAGTNKKVWWKCPIGHEYQASVYSRKNTNCPICDSRKKTSFPEQAIFYYVKKLFPTAINKYKDCFSDGMEFDVYIPEHKTAIEYDGARWHKTDVQHKSEIKKYKFCKKHNIYLIRIKEYSEQSWKDTADKISLIPIIKNKTLHMLEKVIQSLLNELSNQEQCCFDICIEKDKNEILDYLSKIDNSLAKVRPDIATKWDYEKNGNLTPDMFSVSSGEAVWWKCPDCGKEWKAHINDMTRNTYGCPECSKIQRGQVIRKLCVKQKGSLAERNPELAKEWHLIKNGDLTPYDITEGSDKKVWWKCSKCGHEWKTAAKDRGGCPVCKNKSCVSGKNDLMTTHPEVAKEWHPTKNDNLKPTDVVAGSKWKVWWKCSKCGHEWQAVVASRALRCSGCPECIKIQKGQAYVEFCIKKKGSLAERNPELAKEWHPNGCPECAKIQQSKTFIKNLVEKKGSLADNMPELTKEWHPTKNGDLTPYDVTTASGKKVWWKCSKCGEEWQAEVTSRTLSHAGCPKCAKVQRGKTFTKLRAKERGSLADKIPDLAKEWHPTKNGDLKPTEITVGSNKKPWWKCSKCGEEWQATVASRALKHSGCPHCAKKKIKQLEFDFS